MSASNMICIAGMHRSGTSMVARLLHAGGLFLGPEDDLMDPMPDNPGGFWENQKFVAINDEILHVFGGAWDYPPQFPPGWLEDEKIAVLRAEAEALLGGLAAGGTTGWKDPRNSLTLPFWERLCGGLRVVVCVRNPLEVAVSLHRRNYLSHPLSLNLWKIYNQRLIEAVPAERRIVTHYAAYFDEPRRELRRLLDFLGLPASDEKIAGVCSFVLGELRHTRFTARNLCAAGASRELVSLYAALSAEAGFPETLPDEAAKAAAGCAPAGNAAAGIEQVGEPAVERLQLRQSLEAQQAVIGNLERSLEERTAWARRCDALVAGCSETIRGLEGELDSRTAWARQSADGLAERDATILGLQKELDTQSAAGKKSAEETAALNAVIHALQKYLTERTACEKHLKQQHTAAERRARQLRTLADGGRQTIERLGGELRQRDEKIQTMQKQIEEIEALRRAAATLRETLRKQTHEMASLSGMVELLIQAGAAAQTPELQHEIKRRQLAWKICKIASECLPANATVLVTSGGEEELLKLSGQAALHFPQNGAGGHAEAMPADSLAAIAHLEALRAKGAEFILLPAGTPERFAQYPGFHQYLVRHYRLLLREEACVIFHLCPPAGTATPGGAGGFDELITECEERLARDPSILDWNTHLQLAATFSQCMVFSPSDKEKQLPYADQSVDIIALASNDSSALAEAQRVASAAVVRIAPETEAAGGFSMKIEWKLDRKTAAHPSTSIIIPTYNGSPLLRVCLRALKETLPRDVQTEIIVADDGSTDDTTEFLREWAQVDPRLKTVRAKRNAGFIATCNLGMKAAGGEILVFLNNDTVPLPGWLTPLLRTFRDYPDAGAVGGRLIYPTGRLQEAGGVIFSDSSGANFGRNDPSPGAPLYNFVREVDYCSGALLATPRQLCKKLGGFDPHYAPAYYEDTDYCFRIRQNGLRVYYQPESSIVHLEGATSGVDLAAGAKRYQAINHAKFMKRWKTALKKQPRNPGRYDFGVWHALAVRGASNGGRGK